MRMQVGDELESAERERANMYYVDWSRSSQRMRHIHAKSLNNWIVVFPNRDRPVVLNLIDTLHQVCEPFGKNLYLI